MTEVFVARDQLDAFLKALVKGRKVFAAGMLEDVVHLCAEPDEMEPPPHRAAEPVKSLFFSPRGDLGALFSPSGEARSAKRALVGATACDLAALELMDYVFLQGDFVDPFYKAARENTLIISNDCSVPKDECFCTFVDGAPYPEKGFDVNLAKIEGGYIAEAGSEAGEKLLVEQAGRLPAPTDKQRTQKQNARETARRAVENRCETLGLTTSEGLQQAVEKGRHESLWDELADKCVECAACNLVCPTCHCFLLVDLEGREGFKRFRNWDACLYPAFAREASGANPRQRRSERLHGRIDKKFAFMKANFGGWGCVGCGRCIEACAGDIDIRETIRELLNAEPVSSP